jgi:SAM-dependent methyltransferase
VTTRAPFDAVAPDYDREFTYTALGRALRGRVWRRLEARFAPGGRVLELNCGTGEDAAWLAERGLSVVATDQSEAMLAVARRKTAGLPVELAQLDLSAPSLEPYALSLAPFSGAFSNFGGLNCVADLRPLAQSLAAWLRPGAPLVLVVMGPFCLWETGWHALRGHWRAAARRWRSGGQARIGGQTVRVFYPAPGQLARIFAPEFRAVRLSGLGVALPPSLMAAAMERHEWLFATLGALEDAVSGLWPFPHLADHYILELERRA